MKTILKKLLKRSDRLENFLLDLVDDTKPFVPPGHFYSPIPALDYVKKNATKIFGMIPEDIPGVDLREDEQLAVLYSFQESYQELPFADEKTEYLRYFYNNPAYSYSDAIFLYCMIRNVKPKQIIEIGSGYSSCVTLDTNELYFDNSIKVTFIEPYPELLLSLIKDEDKKRIHLLASNLQEIDLAVFKSLGAGDILFIDSSHVVKIYSDVNYIFSEILPSLAPGVLIHFHDIFYPFEYPERWIFENRAWNEIYFLRTFLQYNYAFEIVFHNRYLEHFHREYFEKNMPLCLKRLGASIWIRKVTN
jgi:predicted O-methyltransferase YrrM